MNLLMSILLFGVMIASTIMFTIAAVAATVWTVTLLRDKKHSTADRVMTSGLCALLAFLTWRIVYYGVEILYTSL